MNLKKIFLVLLVITIMGGILAAIVLLYGGDDYPKKLLDEDKDVIIQKDHGLFEEEVRIVEEKVKSVKERIAGFDEETKADERITAQIDLGVHYILLGRLQEARDTYLKALEIDANDHRVYGELFVVEREMKAYNTARRSIDKALELNDIYFKYWRWKIEWERDQFNAGPVELEQLFREAMEKTKNNNDIASIYAQFLERQGRLWEALQNWQLAFDQRPNNSYYKREIERLKNQLGFD